MAGRGPAPKDPERRVRRNKPKPQEQLPTETHLHRFPPLPETYKVTVKITQDKQTWEEDLERTYLPETREWYETWARSPQAPKLAATDRNRLRYVIAPLFDAVVRGDLKKATELRLQETTIGGTVMDRQRLGWKIDEPNADEQRPAAPQSKMTAARRARLTAVK